ncbi:hypothetical protein CRG98_039641 [Punica granatum]|uniref:Uncharacterized protein n=1 Tax=Punica granatum TaxID=22663 RepID=A0A2I0I7L1_PUNGR|nr:hypothetical protein CRG98_039641 [Punica granatum]
MDAIFPLPLSPSGSSSWWKVLCLEIILRWVMGFHQKKEKDKKKRWVMGTVCLSLPLRQLIQSCDLFLNGCVGVRRSCGSFIELVCYPEDPTAASFRDPSSSSAPKASRVPTRIGCLGELHRRHLKHSSQGSSRERRKMNRTVRDSGSRQGISKTLALLSEMNYDFQ